MSEFENCCQAATYSVMYEAAPVLIRRAMEPYRHWVESKLGGFGNLVVISAGVNLAQIAIEKVLNSKCPASGSQSLIERLRDVVLTAEIPDGTYPILDWRRSEPVSDLAELLHLRVKTHSDLDWFDCPVLLRVTGISFPVIAMRVYYHDGPGSDSKHESSLLVARRECIEQVIALLQDVATPSQKSRLVTWNGQSRRIGKFEWDQLILAPETLSLLKNDFESFFQRERWFREKKLPFRRGYLLHGPPGNGKTSAIKAMLNSHSLSAYTLNFSSRKTEESDIEAMFDRALMNKPSAVLFEDLDRVFPRTGEARTNVSLQSLLNAIDGVAARDGLIVIATANNPAVLDPAILRRPGRFDRVIRFANPDAALRLAYFQKVGGKLDDEILRQVVERADGFSFAQLQEAYIIAGQMAFERGDDVQATDLLIAVDLLRRSNAAAASRPNAGGFLKAEESLA